MSHFHIKQNRIEPFLGLPFQGFTLIEMAIVLMIMGLLLGMLMAPLAAQRDAQRYRETRQALKEIREALIGYTLRNGHLPCPARGDLANTMNNAGTEDRDKREKCSQVHGVIPWVTLGVRELDAWGRRYTYRVTDGDDPSHHFTRRTHAHHLEPISPMTFGFRSRGIIEVKDARNMAISVAREIVAIWMSHGRNQSGSWGPDGQRRNRGNANTPEIENSNDDATFVESPHVDSPTDYDDLTEWLHPNILMGRMVAAGRVP